MMLNNFMKRKGLETALRIQVLKSGPSIAANIEEGIAAISRAEFSSELSISYKETRETLFWLSLFYKTNILDEKEYQSFYKDCDEISKLLFSFIRTARSKSS